MGGEMLCRRADIEEEWGLSSGKEALKVARGDG
jgi:hypothetical protein